MESFAALDVYKRLPSDNVNHVVGVDGCKNKVTGQGGLNGNLRCFIITDSYNHYYVLVVPQNRTQTARKRQTFFLVDRNLHDAVR